MKLCVCMVLLMQFLTDIENDFFLLFFSSYFLPPKIFSCKVFMLHSAAISKKEKKKGKKN